MLVYSAEVPAEVVVTLRNSTVTKDGPAAVLAIALSAAPLADVLLVITAPPLSVVPENITIHPTDWSDAHLVRISAAGDFAQTGMQNTTIHVGPSVSADIAFTGLSGAINITVVDADASACVLSMLLGRQS